MRNNEIHEKKGGRESGDRIQTSGVRGRGYEVRDAGESHSLDLSP